MMRISGNGFARIKDSQGRSCVLLNKGQFNRGGVRVLTPIGGGLQVKPSGMDFLLSIGARDFEGDGRDLRCRVPDDEVEQVARWFTRRRQRETSVLRELREELGPETNTLTKRDLQGITEVYRDFFRFKEPTPRQNVPERMTVFLIEVFDVKVPPETMSKLLAASLLPREQRWVYFITPEEQRANRTRDGVKISKFTRMIL